MNSAGYSLIEWPIRARKKHIHCFILITGADRLLLIIIILIILICSSVSARANKIFQKANCFSVYTKSGSHDQLMQKAYY